MDTRDVRVVDAFATEPTGGAPVGIIEGDGLTDDQLQAAATELAADVAVETGDDLRVVGPDGDRTHHPHATVATLAAAAARDEREAGTTTVEIAAGTVDVEITDDSGVWLTLDAATTTESTVSHEDIALALDIDVAALRDVGADLPPTVVSAGVEALAVPVNFLEHLSSATPTRSLLADVLETADADALFAFTFDTMAADTAAHARAFTVGDRWTRTVGLEVPATPAIAGGCLAHLYEAGIIETATTSVEQGHFLDRPGRIHVECDSHRIGGHAQTSLDGTITLPAADEDDIIEA